MAKDEAKKEKEAPKEGAEGAEGEGAPKKKGLLGFLTPKMLMFVVAPALVVILGGAGAYFFLFAGEEAPPEGEHGGAAVAEAEHPVFYDVPEILVNLATSGDKPAYLKLTVSLEIKAAPDDPEPTKALEAVVPRVIDQFQTYLRELRVEDLSGSAAMFRLKEELLRRVNLAAEPVHVEDVLFKEMIVQ